MAHLRAPIALVLMALTVVLGACTAGVERRVDERSFARSVTRAVADARGVHEVIRYGASTRLVLDADLTGAAPAVHERIGNLTNGIRLSTDQVLVGGHLYVRMTGLAHGDRFGRLGSSSPGFAHLTRSIREAEPAWLLRRLLTGVVSVTDTGTTTIAGIPVRRIRLVSRPRGLASLFADSGLGSLARTTARPTTTTQIYVDAHHEPRRISTTLQRRPLTIDLTRWTVPARIQAPAHSGPPGPRVAVG